LIGFVAVESVSGAGLFGRKNGNPAEDTGIVAQLTIKLII
jgi:hypothetical protein